MKLFRRRKDDEVRIQQAVPSLFSSIGREAIVSSPKEAREEAEKERPCAILLVPSKSVYSDSRAWAQALSSASYLVILGDPDSREGKKLMGLLDSIIFSPVPRRLSAAAMVRTEEEARPLIESVGESFPNAITMRVVERDDTLGTEVPN